MSPEEIKTEVMDRTRKLLSEHGNANVFSREEVLALMDLSGIKGFEHGVDFAGPSILAAMKIQMISIESKRTRYRR
jgi:hypothetical protein